MNVYEMEAQIGRIVRRSFAAGFFVGAGFVLIAGLVGFAVS
jgi:formate/nitrite transporter FocA (FNT family)